MEYPQPVSSSAFSRSLYPTLKMAPFLPKVFQTQKIPYLQTQCFRSLGSCAMSDSCSSHREWSILQVYLIGTVYWNLTSPKHCVRVYKGLAQEASSFQLCYSINYIIVFYFPFTVTLWERDYSLLLQMERVKNLAPVTQSLSSRDRIQTLKSL